MFRSRYLGALVPVALLASAAFGQVFSVKTIAGKPVPIGDGGAARSAIFISPASITASKSGQVYVADTGNARIRVIDTDGMVRTYIGTGIHGSSPDKTSIAQAQVQSPRALAIDSQGALYYAEYSKVRKVTGGTVMTVAGTGSYGLSVDGVAATSARLGSSLAHLSFDNKGRLLITDSSNHKIWRVESDGTITTVAGTGQQGSAGDGGAANKAQLSYPNAAVADDAGNIYIADTSNAKVRKVAPDGKISTYAGGGSSTTNDVPATQSYVYPYDLAIEESGNLLIKEYSSIRRVSLTGMISQVLSGATGSRMAVLGTKYWSLVNSSSGQIYQGTLTSTAAPALIAGRQRFEGDGGKATDALLQSPNGLAVNTQGQIYIADTSNARIRAIDAAGMIRTIVGGGSAALSSPAALTFCPDGNLYFADGYTRIKQIDASGAVSTIAGNGGYVTSTGALEGSPLSVSIGQIRGLACDSAGTLYFGSSNYSSHVYKLPKGGSLSLLSEAGTFGLGATGKPKKFDSVRDVSFFQDKLLVAEYGRILQVGGDGQITVLAGGGNQRPATGTVATAANISSPRGFARNDAGDLIFSAWDGYPPGYGQKIFRLESTGTITVLAGGGSSFVDGGAALATSTSSVNALAALSGDRIIFEDNSMIRMLEPVTASAIVVHSGDKQKAAPGARAANPVVAKVIGGSSVPIPGVEVTFSVTPADARVSPAKAVTDSQGLAATVVTMGRSEGEVKVTARSGSFTPAEFTLTSEAPKPASMNITRGDRQSVYAGTVASIPLEVILRTADGAPAPGATVAFAVVDGQAALSAGSAVTGLDGKAAVTVKPAAAGTVIVEASSSGLAAVRFTLTVEPAIVMPAVRDYMIETFAGAPPPEGGVSGPEVLLLNPSYGMAFDPQGGLVFGDTGRQQLMRVGPDGVASVLAGQFGVGATGDLDGEAAEGSSLYWPWSVAVSPDGALYFVNRTPTAIYRLNTDGTLSRIVGTGSTSGGGTSAENAQAKLASTSARGIGFLPTGELVYADYSSHQVRKVNANGTVSTLAGGDRTAGYTGDGQAALQARLRNPDALVVAPDGTIVFADSGNYRIRAIAPDGKISTIAGNGTAAITGNGGAAVAAGIGRVQGLVYDQEGNLLISAGTFVRKIRPDGGIESLYDLSGRASVYGLAIAPGGALYAGVSMAPAGDSASGVRVVRFEPDGSMTTVAGGAPTYMGDDGPARDARFFYVSSLALQSDGALMLADDGNKRIRKISPDGTITTIAGGGSKMPDSTAAVAAEIDLSPENIALAPDGNLYFTDRGVSLGVASTDGTVKLLYGTPSGKPRIESDLPAELNRFIALATDSQSNLYFAATDNSSTYSIVYRRSPAGELTLIAGAKDGKVPAATVPAKEARFQRITALAMDRSGALCFAESRGWIFCIDPEGALRLLGGDTSGSRTEGMPVSKFRFSSVMDMAFDSEGDLIVAEGSALLKFAPGGGVAVIAGSLSQYGYKGDGGPATSALFGSISSVVVDAGGNLYVGDMNAMRIRKLSPAPK